ncbi:MAG TPA: gephyrin-like molybdotransferase Glp [Acetobacteraceae bacterium]|jgi:molybdopterin molybdotransferase|nr:gephyrin-like molybdotransferase Glp [Acetobacteraceae bacterium]
MISVEEARDRILAALHPTPGEVVALADAWNRVTAMPITARLTQPPADVSAMDGYALRAVDGNLGATLKVIGSAPAGHPFSGKVGPGQAVRLFTGSFVPHGADAILLQEDATATGTDVRVNEAVAAGRHIRRSGQDFAAGDTVVPAARRLTARDIGLAAAGNHPWLTVHRRPRVAILATGDEIAMPGEPIPPGGIVSSNSHALAALVRAAGGQPVVLPVAADTREAVAAAADAVHGMDILVTTGGASVGDHDLVIESLKTRGLELDFWQIAMRPGKPLLFGKLGPVAVLGLPGNPVSALVCSILFLLPALSRMSGLPAGPPPTIQAFAGAALRANDHRADHLRATVTIDPNGRIIATPFPVQDSAMLRRLALADALILRAPNAPALPEGNEITVIRLDSLGI